MVQIFSPGQSPQQLLSEQLGQALGQGITKRFPPQEQLVQQRLLQDAMNKMQGSGSFEQKLTAIMPTLATTPGGSEILSTMMPLLQRQQAAEAYQKYMAANYPQGEQSAQPSPTPSVAGQPTLETQTGLQPPQKPSARYPGSTVSPESTYPERTTEPQPVPLMTPQEKQRRRQELNLQAQAQGTPLNPAEIENTINIEDQSRIKYNEQIQAEKEIRENAWDVMQAKAVKRAENSDLFKDPEDQTVFQKFVNESRRAENPNKIYEEARDKFREFENARTAITNEYDVPGKIGKFWRQSSGTYKDTEDLIKSVRPHVKKIMDMGLIPEARNLLANSLGLGPEDIERTMYPPTPKEKNAYNSFRPNPNQGKVFGFSKGYAGKEDAIFPGEESALSPDNYVKFKDNIEKMLDSNPEANLITLRGNLNSDKRYGWQDINRAIVELIEEGRFSPDGVQKQQLNVIKQAPMPGMGQMFKHVWTGTK